MQEEDNSFPKKLGFIVWRNYLPAKGCKTGGLEEISSKIFLQEDEEDVLDDSQSRRKTCEVSVAHFA